MSSRLVERQGNGHLCAAMNGESAGGTKVAE
jgi:hypothetical protein